MVGRSRLAAVGPGDHLDDRESETGSVTAAAFVGTREALKRTASEVRRESAALIADVKLYRVVRDHGGEGYYAFAVTQRVLEQVAQRLLEP